MMPTQMDIMLDPAKHGYAQCSRFNGYGSSLQEDGDRCSRCGGIGLVKVEQEKKCGCEDADCGNEKIK